MNEVQADGFLYMALKIILIAGGAWFGLIIFGVLVGVFLRGNHPKMTPDDDEDTSI